MSFIPFRGANCKFFSFCFSVGNAGMAGKAGKTGKTDKASKAGKAGLVWYDGKLLLANRLVISTISEKVSE